jgi:hypothetical protein
MTYIAVSILSATYNDMYLPNAYSFVRLLHLCNNPRKALVTSVFSPLQATSKSRNKTKSRLWQSRPPNNFSYREIKLSQGCDRQSIDDIHCGFYTLSNIQLVSIHSAAYNDKCINVYSSVRQLRLSNKTTICNNPRKALATFVLIPQKD